MPSKAYKTFLDLLIDVEDLIDTHRIFSGGTPGKKKLGYLTRSGVVMLCAAWEFFNEELLLESIDIINKRNISIHDLPIEVQKTISNKVKKDANEIKPIELAGEGWRTVWKNVADEETQTLNTPKRDKLNLLFNKYLGILRVSHFWKNFTPQEIDAFVSVRGDIAHKGRKAKYVRIGKLKEYFDMIKLTAIDSDSFVAEEIKNLYQLNKVPWSRTY